MHEKTIVVIILILAFLILSIKTMYDIFLSEYLFYPTKVYSRIPTMDFLEIDLPKGVKGWHLHNYPESKTILYCHGNAGNISEWNDMIELIHSQKLNLFIFDYRGFGKSEGYASVSNMIEDAHNAYKFISKTVLPENIVVWGESMGGVAALSIAEKNSIGCLVLAGTFTNPADLAKMYDLKGLLNIVAKLIDIDNVKSLKKVISKNIPIAIIHSVEDDVIPYECGEKLYKSIPENYPCKQFIPILGTHAEPRMTVEDLRWLFEFCEISTDFCDIADVYLRNICENGKKICPFTLSRGPKSQK